jgi:hypothetical protein
VELDRVRDHHRNSNSELEKEFKKITRYEYEQHC